MADVRQIRVAGVKVGIAGLDQVLERVAGESIDTDEETAGRLLDLVRQTNYVRPRNEQEYRQALLREFKRYRGEPVSEEPGGLEIRVLGPGCARCDKLTNEVMSVLSDLEIDADFEHVRDLTQIATFGPVATPALVINGTVVTSGRVPRRADIIRYIGEAGK
jgi:small redox-active disulfide protein 2